MANKKNMTKPTRTDVSELGEFGLIDRIRSMVSSRYRSTVHGIGDDCAVLDNGEDYTLLSVDTMVEGLHFDLMYCPLQHVGYKAIVSSVSDIYAMNGKPSHVVVSLSLSSKYSVEAVEELYKGMERAASFYNIDIVGGDTTSSLSGATISVTAYGRVKKEQLVLRSGANPGDALFVTGNLGGAFMGLQVLNREKQIFLQNPDMQPELEGHDYVVGRQLKPEARYDVIEALAKASIVPTAMIDISDGLSSECLHLAKSSKVGVEVHEQFVPIQQETYDLSLELNIDPITSAMNGGEDYELLFTVDPSLADRVREEVPDCIEIGIIHKEEKGSFLTSRTNQHYPLTAQGWKAF